MMSTSIVVGTDGTEASHVAVRWALDRAAATGAVMRLVHVFDDEWETVGPRVIDDLRCDAKRVLEREMSYVQSISSAVAVEADLLTGDPMRKLAEISKDAGMVVVGTHKTGYVHGKVIGSRSLRLVAAAHCTVAIIPESVRHDARGIVVGADNSTGGRAAIDFASGEASRLLQSLTLVRGWVPPRIFNESEEVRAERDRLIEATVNRALDDSASAAQRGHPSLELRRRNIRRAPAEALLEAGSSSQMLVVGSTRREIRDRMGLGPVTHDVVLNLVTATVVVHDDDAH
jgi:nucleotide-binding universal stress UspA family protein